MKLRGLPVWALLHVLLVCGGAPFAQAQEKSARPPRQVFSVSFRPWRGHGGPLVEVRLNDKVSGTFLIDTGASECTMTEKLAAKLGLKARPAFKSDNVLSFDGYNQADFVQVKRVQIGSLTYGDAPFIILEERQLFDGGEQPLDGLIGGSLLRQFAVFFDYPRQRIDFFYPTGLSDQAVENLGIRNAHVIPLKPFQNRDDSNLYAVSAQFTNNTRSGKEDLLVDTGAPGTNISQKLAEQLQLSSIRKSAASTMFNGSYFGEVARVQTLRLGDFALPNHLVEYAGRKGSEIPSLIGADVLAYCYVVFDYGQRKLYLKPVLPPLAPGSIDKPIDPNRIDRAGLRQAARLPPIPYSSSLEASPSEDDVDGPARIAVLQKAMKNDATDADRHHRLGRIYRAEKEKAKAQEAFAKAIEGYHAQIAAKPEDPLLLASLSEALTDADRDDEAETAARKAVVLAPGEAKTWIALGWALHARSLWTLTKQNETVALSLDDQKEHQALVAKLLADPPAPVARTRAAELGKQARDCFDKAVALAPQSPEAFQARADFHKDHGQGIVAPLRALQGETVNLWAEVYGPAFVQDMERLGRLNPDNVDVLRTLAFLDVNVPVYRNERFLDFRDQMFWRSLPKKSRQAAEEKMDRLKQLGESKDAAIAARALEALGELLWEVVHDLPQAEATLRKALVLDPSRTRAAHTLAHFLTQQRRSEEIVAFLEPRVQKQDVALDRLLLAKALEKLGRHEQAEAQVQAAVKLRPDSFTPNLALAALMLRRSSDDDSGKALLAQAGASLDKAAKQLGNDPDPDQKIAYTLLRAVHQALGGDPTAAKRQLLRVLEDNNTNTEAREVLAALAL